MTSKEKAEDLVLSFLRLRKYNKTEQGWSGMDKEMAIKCAMIVVNEIMEIKSVERDIKLYNLWWSVVQELEKMN